MKRFIPLFLLFTTFVACQNQTDKYSVNGTITGLDSGLIYLMKVENGKPVVSDTAEIVNGKFTFTGSKEAPELAFLRINERDYFAQFFLENAKIKIEAYKDSLRASKITGSPNTDVLNLYFDEITRLNKKTNALQQQFNEAGAAGNEEEQGRILSDYNAMSDSILIFSRNFIHEHNNTVASPFLLFTKLAPRMDYEDLKELVDNFIPELNNNEFVIKLNEILDSKANTAIGAVAPEITMNNVEGHPFSLSSLRGKYVLIDFWASWCGPCRQENPNVVEAYNNFKDKGFDILGVSLDRDKNKWLQAIEEDQLNWHHVSDLKDWQNEAAKEYGINSIPQSFLIDSEGRIVAKNLRGAELHAKLQELLN